jgi:hypothetical protein
VPGINGTAIFIGTIQVERKLSKLPPVRNKIDMRDRGRCLPLESSLLGSGGLKSVSVRKFFFVKEEGCGVIAIG